MEGLAESGVGGATELSVGSLSSLERCDYFAHTLLASGLLFVHCSNSFGNLLFEVRELLLYMIQVDAVCLSWRFLRLEPHREVLLTDE